MTDQIQEENSVELSPSPVSEELASTGRTLLSRLFPFVLAFVLFSATFWSISVFGLTIYRDYLMVPEEVKVPDVTKLEIQDAFNKLESLGLRLQVHENRHDKKVKKRIVLSQNPAANKLVRKGRTVLVVVSLGPELMEVPNLVGSDLRAAKITLSNSKLQVGKISFEEPAYDEDEAVLKQNPAAGKEVPRGEPVALTVRRAWR